MPQKPVFKKAPVLTVPHCFPSNGTIRTADPRIEKLYQKAGAYVQEPCLWEGLFRLACLLKNRPAQEPVSALITEAAAESESGAFPGSIGEQVSTARAAFALFEYNTDRSILRRIAQWLRFLEIDFEQLSQQDYLLYRPADLMELLIRYYRVTGVRSVLRICAKLRASAFDWTTALHTFQQSIPIRFENGGFAELKFAPKPEEMEYDEKEKLINHAVMLADGVRFSTFAGLFSGHKQDLTSGRTVWNYLARHHRALCGGTSADPYLCGCSADREISNLALAAWTEAFAAQMILPDSEWATDELVRIVYNGLADCLNRENVATAQKMNTFGKADDSGSVSAELYARLTRAAARAYSHTVTLTEEGIRINYLLDCRCLAMIQKTPVILHMTDRSVRFECKKPFSAPVDLFIPRTQTSRAAMVRGAGITVRNNRENDPETGSYLHTEETWADGFGFDFEESGRILCEETHHQGVCFFHDNRLLSLKAEKNQYAFIALEEPKWKNGKILISTGRASGWKTKGKDPADIPVLPEACEPVTEGTMTPYAETCARITMFPRAKDACLK